MFQLLWNQYATEFFGLITSAMVVGWLTNTLSSLATVRRIKSGSKASKIAHLVHGISDAIDKEPFAPETKAYIGNYVCMKNGLYINSISPGTVKLAVYALNNARPIYEVDLERANLSTLFSFAVDGKSRYGAWEDVYDLLKK